jgi:mRNA interferase MazF
MSYNSLFSVKRGEVYFADIGEGIGSEQSGVRPVLILQNDVGNKHSPTTIVALMTSSFKKLSLPVHLLLKKEKSLLPSDSIILLEQIRTIDKQRLIRKISQLDEDKMTEINQALSISMGITPILVNE